MPLDATPRPISDAELETLKVLWDLGPSAAGPVRHELARRGRIWAYMTTKTILDRLEAKRYVRRDRRTTPHIYLPILSVDQLARQQLGALREALFDGSDLPLARALLDGARLSKRDIAELRSTLDALSRERGSR
ncbi:MAG TPA: BlaI/MecI/CopY family transcriptional regulator [Pleomorphomonadaceae bacterium]|nr:BlaI/MecI/CopY family transcriptional regulator [Pleomorphomonadaceae bacterium]